MLDQQTFLQGINYLKANYINWGFDLNNDLMLKVWFKKLSNLDAATFMGLIEKYTDTNKFAPNSPADLLELMKEQLTLKQMDPNDAWAEVITLIRRYGFYYHRQEIYKAIEDKPVLKLTVEQFENDLRNLEVGDTNTPVRFKNAYKINLQREVERQSIPLLASGTLKLLEEK